MSAISKAVDTANLSNEGSVRLAPLVSTGKERT